MRSKNSTVAPDQEIVELILGLLDDFEEKAKVIIEARQQLERAKTGSDNYYRALAQIEVWMTGVTTLAPGILEELERLEESSVDG